MRQIRSRSPIIPLFIVTVFFLSPLLTTPGSTYSLEQSDLHVDRYELDVIENDWLLIYTSPISQNVSAQCQPVGTGSPFSLSIQTVYTDEFFGRVTAVGLLPESSGGYNLTATFSNNATWEYMIGVYTRSPGFYAEYWGKNVKIYGYFVKYPSGPQTRPPEKRTISVMVNSHGQGSSSFSIELPTPVNSILLIATVGLILYLNVFIFADTYFKHKKETVSGKRWIVFGIVIVISAIAIYGLYNFTTFALKGGV